MRWQRVKPDRIARPLTPGEVELARSVFGDALALDRVRVNNRPYLPGQGRGVAMAPNGHLWFRPEDHLADFSGAVGTAAWLVHELTHVWQHQTGRSVRLRGLVEQTTRLFGVDPYSYGPLDPARAFASYKNEQQAAIVEDYFRLRQGQAPRNGTGELPAYQRSIPFVMT